MNTSLFTRDLVVATLASGSSGNCTYIGDGHAGLLIDCGVSTKQILARLDSVGLQDAPIDAVLVTHEHGDHVGAARVLCKRLAKRTGRAVPFYMTRGTAGGLRPQTTPDAIETVEPGESFKVGHLVIDPFTVPHDTRDPVAYRVGSGGTWVGVVTDLGKPTALVTEMLRSMSLMVLEFNHDEDLLMEGSYPWALKQRIRSSHGHLSNEQAGSMLTSSVSESLREVVLAHLSDENNRPQLALARAVRALADAGADDHVRVQLGWQHKPCEPVAVRVRDW